MKTIELNKIGKNWTVTTTVNKLNEERAKEYFNNECLHTYADNQEELKEDVTKAFLDGLKEGRKEKWHDLRKNPDDLPKYNEDDDEDNFYLVAFKSFYNQKDIVTREFMWNGKEFIEEDYSEIPYFRKPGNLIAWTELPKFEE